MTEDQTTDQAPDGADALGDAGKRALDRMKQERNEARNALQAFQQIGLEPDALAEIVKRHTEHDAEAAIAQARRDAEQEVRGKFHARLRDLAVRSEATARGFHRPEDAVLFIGSGLESIPVSDDGEVDTDAVKAALDKVMENHGYLVPKVEEPTKFAPIDVGLVGGGAMPLNGDGIEDALKKALGIA